MPLTEKDLHQLIQTEYERRDDRLGWGLLHSPLKTISGARIAFIGLNPAGHQYHEPYLSYEGGSAYVDQGWSQGCYRPGMAPLQRQIRALFDCLGVQPAEVLAGNLVPFRSPKWEKLSRRPEALRFGCELWRMLLLSAKPSLVVTMGRPTAIALANLLQVPALRAIPVGWGNISARFGQADGVRLVGLPHLSRYSVIGRPQSRTALAQLFGRSSVASPQ